MADQTPPIPTVPVPADMAQPAQQVQQAPSMQAVAAVDPGPDSQNPFLQNRAPVVDPGPDSENPFIQGRQSVGSDIVRAVKHVPIDVERQAGETAQFAGHVASDMGLMNVGAWLSQQGQGLVTNAASQENFSNMPSLEQRDGGFLRNVLPGAASGLGQLGGAAGVGTVAGGVVGGLVGAVGGLGIADAATIPAGIAWGSSLGRSLAMLLQLGEMSGSAAEQTHDAVYNAQIAKGAAPADAEDTAVKLGAGSGAVMGALQFALQKAGLGQIFAPTLARAVGAKAGETVMGVLDNSWQKAAIDVAKTTGEMAGITGAQTAGTQLIDQAGGAGDGPTLGGTLQSAAEGGVMGLVTGTMGAARANAKTSSVKKLLADPDADPQARVNAALGVKAALLANNQPLALDYGRYAVTQIAKGLPVETHPDAFYTDAAREIRSPSKFLLPAPVVQSAPPQLNDLSGIFHAPDLETAVAETEQTIQHGMQGGRPVTPADVNGIVNNAIAEGQQTVAAEMGQGVAAANAEGTHAGVITPAGSEMTPSAENLAGERDYYQNQANQANQDVRNQAIDANKPVAPAVPEDAFAQRQAQMEAEQQATRDAALQQGNREQLADHADQQTAVSNANDTAPAQSAKPGTPEAPVPATPAAPAGAMGQAMQTMFGRKAAQMQSNPARVTTDELATLAQHHPDPAVRQQAAQLAEARNNNVFSQDQPSQPFSLDSVRDSGHFSFSPERGEQPAGAAAEPTAPVRTLEQTEPAVAPVKAALDQEARATGQAASSASIETVDPASLPDVRTPANNGVEGATTMSKSDHGLVQKLAALFGKKVVLFRQQGGGSQADGLINRKDTSTIYLNADASGAHHLVVVGHELAHAMSVDAPKLFNTMRKAVLKEVSKGAKSAFYRDHLSGMSDEDVQAAMKDPATLDRMTEEFVADMVGNRVGEFRTWQQIFANIDKGNRSMVYRVADYITKFIDKLLGNESFKKFATDDMVNNLRSVRQAVRRGLSEYAVQNGAKAMEHEAGQLRAHQENLREGIAPRKLVEPVEPRAFVGKEPSKAAPAPVAERPLSDAQGARSVDAMEPPKKYGKAPVAAAPAEDGLTVAGQQRAEALKAAAEAAKVEPSKPEAPTQRKPIEQPQVVKGQRGDAPPAEPEGGMPAPDAPKPNAPNGGVSATTPDAAQANREARAARAAKRAEKAQKEADAAQKQAEAKAKRSAAASKAILQQYKVNPERDSLLTAVAKLGGVSAAEVKSLFGKEGKEALYRHGIKLAVTSKGMSMDNMATRLQELGYLHSDDPTTEFERKFNDGIGNGGQEHYTHDALQRQAQNHAEEDYNEHQLSETNQAESGLNELPVAQQHLVEEDTHDGPYTAAEEDQIAAHYDSLVPEEYERSAAESEYFGDDTPREGVAPEDRAPVAGRAEEGNGRANETQPSAEAQREPGSDDEEFGLTGETPAEAEARLQQENAARKERTRAALDEERRMQADEDAKNFRLTGSDRPADAEPGQDDFRFSYGGERAASIRPQGLENAKARLANGEDPEAIRKETGWFQGGIDGKWRTEIDDSRAKLHRPWDQVEESPPAFGKDHIHKLGDLLDHPELYAAYPEVRDMPVTKKGAFLDFEKLTYGWFEHETGKLSVTPYAPDPLSVMLHEVQHWIQNREGFDKGGASERMRVDNPENFAKLESHLQGQKQELEALRAKLDKTGDSQRTRDLKELNTAMLGQIDDTREAIQQLRKQMPKNQAAYKKAEAARAAIKELQQQLDELAKKHEAVRQAQDAAYEKAKAEFEVENAKRDATIRAAQDKAFEPGNTPEDKAALSAAYAVPRPQFPEYQLPDYATERAERKPIEDKIEAAEARVKAAEKNIGQGVDGLNKVKHGLYQLLTGEREARDVQQRQGMDVFERRDTPPYSTEGIRDAHAIRPGKDSATGEASTSASTRSPFITRATDDGLERMHDRTVGELKDDPANERLKAQLQDISNERLNRASQDNGLDFRFSRQRASSFLGPLDKGQEAALKEVGGLTTPKTVRQQMDEMKADLGKKLIQGISDQFYPIKELSPEAYREARRSKGYTGPLEAAILYGKPFLRDGVPDVDANDEGYAHILSGLDGEHSRFFWWMAAQRAEELKKQGRENLFTDKDISNLLTLNKKDAQHPLREQKFAEALVKHNAMNTAILDIVRQSGLFDNETFNTIKDQIHVSFYRVLDDGNGMRGPGKGDALINQVALKKLKGGTNKLNEDLLANTLNNWGSLLGAAMRNKAAQLTMDAASAPGIGAATKVSYNKASKNAVRVMVNGKAQFYEIHDPHLLTAVSAMSASVPTWMKPLATFKHLLTAGTTLAPTFRVNSLIRETLATMAITDIGLNPAKNLVQGWKAMSHGNQTHASMLASGGLINFGSMLEGNEAKRANRLVAMGVDRSTILNSPGAVQAFWSKVQKAGEWYHEIGNKVENANRAALYEQLVAKGVGHAEASFQARDIMDFSLQGSNNVVRFLTTAVPFLNARIQGAYKIGRAVHENPQRAGMMMGAVAMASLGLMLWHQNDPDWKARPDWDRDNYWWFKIGNKPWQDDKGAWHNGHAFRIPKPFELGAVGTVVERTWEKMFDPEMTNSRYIGELRDVLMNQFNLNPTPQIIKPLLNVYANRDDFTGNQIESGSMQSEQPEQRYTPYTSMTARFLGQLGLPDPSQLMLGRYSKLSPVQMDSLIRGYFGWTGTMATTMADAAVRPFSSNGAKPAMTLKTKTLGFLEDLPANQSRYADTLYENADKANQAYASWQAALKSGQPALAREIMNGTHLLGPDNKTLIREHGVVTGVAAVESQLALQAKRIADSPNLSADTKRAMLDRIDQRRNNLARIGSMSEMNMAQRSR